MKTARRRGQGLLFEFHARTHATVTSSEPQVARRFQDFGLSRSSFGDNQNPELCGYPTMAQLRVLKVLGLGPQVERRLGFGFNPKP